MSSCNKQEEKKKNNTCRYPSILFQKKWGVYTWNALDVFVMNKKGEAVFPFSRRRVPVNLFSYVKIQTATRSERTFCPISGSDIIKPNDDDHHKIDERQNGITRDKYQRCSTPKSFVGKLSTIDESYDNRSSSNWPPTDDDDDDEYQWSEFNYDPYESYDWEC